MSYTYLTAPAAGSYLAVDVIATINFPRTKISFGTEGISTDVSASDPLPVEAPALQSGESDFTVVPSDVAAISAPPRAVYVGGAGDITLRLIGSSGDRVYKNVPAGTILPITPQYIRSTGTTATFMIGIL